MQIGVAMVIMACQLFVIPLSLIYNNYAHAAVFIQNLHKAPCILMHPCVYRILQHTDPRTLGAASWYWPRAHNCGLLTK